MYFLPVNYKEMACFWPVPCVF